MIDSNCVSITKAIGIFMMVIAHAGCASQLRDFIYMFHMPLFFIVSGYCFKEKHLNNVYTFIGKRIKGLWWAYVKWGLLFLLLHNVFFHLNIYNSIFSFNGNISSLYTLNDFIDKGVKIFIFAHSEQLLGGYWFLRILFYASILGYFTIKCLNLSQNPKIRIFCMIIILVIAHFDIPIIGNNVKIFMSTFFFLIGYELQKRHSRFNYSFNLLSANKQIIVVMACVTITIVGSRFWFGEISTINNWKIVPYSITAVIGTIMTFIISYWLSIKKTIVKDLLVFSGKHTLEILTWHFLCFKFVSLAIIYSYNLEIERLALFPTISKSVINTNEYGINIQYSFWWVVYSFAGIGVPLLIIRFMNLCKLKQNS